MKHLPIHIVRAGPVRFGLTLGTIVFASSLAIAEPTPVKSPGKAKEKTAETKPEPTPEAKVDAKTEADILLAEDRFINAIKNGDAKALGELLHDLYSDALGKYAKKATNKRGTLARVTTGRLPAYRIEKERKMNQNGELFWVEGLARAERQNPTDEPADKWFRVRRLWTKVDDRWVLSVQAVSSPETTSPEPDAKALETH